MSKEICLCTALKCSGEAFFTVGQGFAKQPAIVLLSQALGLYLVEETKYTQTNQEPQMVNP
jgi:hypothetical protein